MVQLSDHICDVTDKVVRHFFAVLNPLQTMLPLGGEQRRLQLLRQYRDQRDTFIRGNQMLGALVPLTLHKARGYELFQYPGTGSRSAYSFALRIFWGFLRTCMFHRCQQRILGVVLGRGGFALFQLGNHRPQGFTYLYFGNRILSFAFLTLVPASQTALIGCFGDFPSHLRDHFRLAGEADALTLQLHTGFLIYMGIAHSTEQSNCHQLNNIPDAGCQRFQISFEHTPRGNDGVVVGHLFIVDDLTSIDGEIQTRRVRKGFLHFFHQFRQHIFHVAGQILTVRAGISQELLFIEGLHVLQRLLGGVAKHSVGVTLQGGQVVELGRLFGFLDLGDAFHHRRFQIALLVDGLCFFLAFDSLGLHQKTAAQLHRVEGFRLERPDGSFAGDDHGECGRNHTPHIESRPVHQGIQTACIDAHQPISLRPAQSCLIQRVKVRTIHQVQKSGADCTFFQRGSPEPLHGLCATCHVVDQTEYQLTFTTGVGGTDDFIHRGVKHQSFDRHKLLLALFADAVFPCFRYDGKIIPFPFEIAGIVLVGRCQLDQMPDTPGNDATRAENVAAVLYRCPDHIGDSVSNGAFLSNDQLHGSHSFQRRRGTQRTPPGWWYQASDSSSSSSNSYSSS